MLSSKEALTHDEHVEIDKLEKYFDHKLPKGYMVISRTKKATEDLLKQFELLEIEYQEMLIDGDLKTMMSQQSETQRRVHDMLTGSRALIKQAEAEGEDADTVSTETIVDLLLQGAFKVAQNIVN